MAGPDVEPGARIRGATVYDVFPTALYLLDLPVPVDLPGRAPTEAVHTRRPLRVAPALEPRNVADPRPIPTESDEGYLEGLRALGYVVD